MLHPGDDRRPRAARADRRLDRARLLVDNTSVAGDDRRPGPPATRCPTTAPRCSARLARCCTRARRRSPRRSRRARRRCRRRAGPASRTSRCRWRHTCRRTVVLAVSEHREDFPGVAIADGDLPELPERRAGRARARLHRRRSPRPTRRNNPTLTDADTIGVSAGSKQQYDSVLRGVDGTLTKTSSPQGYSVSDGELRRSGAGRHARDQHRREAAAAGRAVAGAADRRQPQGRQARDRPARSSSMDPQTGRVLAVGELPRPTTRSCSSAASRTPNYRKLTAPSANDPLLSRAIAGQYAPGLDVQADHVRRRW